MKEFNFEKLFSKYQKPNNDRIKFDTPEGYTQHIGTKTIRASEYDMIYTKSLFEERYTEDVWKLINERIITKEAFAGVLIYELSQMDNWRRSDFVATGKKIYTLHGRTATLGKKIGVSDDQSIYEFDIDGREYIAKWNDNTVQELENYKTVANITNHVPTYSSEWRFEGLPILVVKS